MSNLKISRLLAKVLRNRQPVSKLYGLDRGAAIDRLYIEEFLEKEKLLIKGHCLEILGTDYDYARRFGGSRVKQLDILDIDQENKAANIHGDLRNLPQVADNIYDTIVLTQTIHVIDDTQAVLDTCYRILKPGGVLLATLPSISRVDVAAGLEDDFWRFTGAGTKYLFGKVFGQKNMTVKTYGNVLAGLGFWVGLAQEDLSKADLEYNDPNFPVLVTVRATKK